MLPIATVINQIAVIVDFIEAGASVKENSNPVTENITSPIVIRTN